MTSDSDPIEVWLVSGSHQRAPQPGSSAPGPSPRLAGSQAAVKPELDTGKLSSLRRGQTGGSGPWFQGACAHKIWGGFSPQPALDLATVKPEQDTGTPLPGHG